MRDFSLDLISEEIHSAQTRSYFVEVLKSYYTENYRSAIVMLYTISIADLVYKVRDLQDIYSDPSAEQIMKEITRLQTSHPTSPDWESKLIEMVKDQTNLLEPADYLHMTSLQKLRHLCAHPVLTQNFELYSPNRETVRSHIRNILEGLLIKPPLLSRKILDDFLANLSLIKTIIHDDNELESHLRSKYFDKLKGKALRQVFRALWKIVFKIRDQPSNDNRAINLKALLIMVKNNYDSVIEMMRDEQDYYSDVSMDNGSELISLLNRFPRLNSEFADSLSIMSKNMIETNADLDMQAIFLSGNINDHIRKIIAGQNEDKYINSFVTVQSIIDVYNYAVVGDQQDMGYSFLIHMFGKSSGYDMADIRFSTLIKPYLQEFNISQLIDIVQKVNTNQQISTRRQSRSDNRLIKARVDAVDSTFNYQAYQNFDF